MKVVLGFELAWRSAGDRDRVKLVGSCHVSASFSFVLVCYVLCPPASQPASPIRACRMCVCFVDFSPRWPRWCPSVPYAFFWHRLDCTLCVHARAA